MSKKTQNKVAAQQQHEVPEQNIESLESALSHATRSMSDVLLELNEIANRLAEVPTESSNTVMTPSQRAIFELWIDPAARAGVESALLATKQFELIALFERAEDAVAAARARQELRSSFVGEVDDMIDFLERIRARVAPKKTIRKRKSGTSTDGARYRIDVHNCSFESSERSWVVTNAQRALKARGIEMTRDELYDLVVEIPSATQSTESTDSESADSESVSESSTESTDSESDS